MRKQQEEIEKLQKQAESCSAEIEEQQKLQWELEKKLERLSFCRDQVPPFSTSSTKTTGFGTKSLPSIWLWRP